LNAPIVKNCRQIDTLLKSGPLLSNAKNEVADHDIAKKSVLEAAEESYRVRSNATPQYQIVIKSRTKKS
jgi:hypothetical protein